MYEEYPEVYFPEHHRAKKNGCVDRHIIEAEKMIGRELKEEEVVHHIDGDRFNYNHDNLLVFVDQTNHARFHKTGRYVETNEKRVVYSPKEYIDRCVLCNKPIGITKHGKCRDCLSKERRKVNRQSVDELKCLISKCSMLAIGKMYGVSGNSVRKWCRSYGIEYRK